MVFRRERALSWPAASGWPTLTSCSAGTKTPADCSSGFFRYAMIWGCSRKSMIPPRSVCWGIFRRPSPTSPSSIRRTISNARRSPASSVPETSRLERQQNERCPSHAQTSASANPITIPPSNAGAAGIKAIKFHDPERHPLELIYFPAGKGNPSWQNPGKLFRGVDHTAMAVPSTDNGVTFYRDLLGFSVGVTTLNSGPTQDVLDGLLNDTCLVTAMMPPSAPPHVRRVMPAETKSNDLWHWQPTLGSRNIQALAGRLRQAGAPFISSSVVTIPPEAQARLGFKKAVMIRDPNGHALRLVEE